MATPAFQKQSGAKTVSQGNAGALSFNARDLAGAAVDISTGYGAKIVVRASNAKDTASPLLSQTTGFTLNADGTADLALTAAQINAVPVGRWALEILVSNDGTPFATTQAVIHAGQLTVEGILQ